MDPPNWNYRPSESSTPKVENGRHRIRIRQRSFYFNLEKSFSPLLAELAHMRAQSPLINKEIKPIKCLKKVPPALIQEFKQLKSKEEVIQLFQKCLEEDYQLHELIDFVLHYDEIPCFILAMSRDLAYLSPRREELEHELGSLDFKDVMKLKKYASKVFRYLYQPQDDKYPLPDLKIDPLFITNELVNETLDRIERIIKEIVDTEITFQNHLQKLLDFTPFLNSAYFDDFCKLYKSTCQIVNLLTRKPTIHSIENVLEVFSPQTINEHMILFLKPIHAIETLDSFFKECKEEDLRDLKVKNNKIGALDIIVMPMQRLLRYGILLESLSKTLPEGLLRKEIEKRGQYIKRWGDFANMKLA